MRFQETRVDKRHMVLDDGSMECRIVLTRVGAKTEVGMHDPVSGRYEALGQHSPAVLEKVVKDLKTRMEREGHTVTFCER